MAGVFINGKCEEGQEVGPIGEPSSLPTLLGASGATSTVP